MKHPIGNTRNGVAVYVDLIHSEAAKRIAEQPYLLNLVAEALQQTTLQGEDLRIERNMGRIVGYDFVVTTDGTESIFYAQLVRHKTYVRFVKNGVPLSTQSLSLVLRQSDDNAGYDLQDAWIGHLSPPQPGTADETKESRPYWERHAFVLSNQSLQLRTVTKSCPY